MKRIISCVLCLILVVVSCSTVFLISASSVPKIYFDNVLDNNGESVTLELCIKDNTGIAGLLISLNYDSEVLTLTSAENGSLFSGFTAGKNFAWDHSSNVTQDGTLATFCFDIDNAADIGEYKIEVVVRSCIDEELSDVAYSVLNGIIIIGNSRTPGDANGDGSINAKDCVVLMQYINGWDINVTVEAADVNDDGKVNNKDYVLLVRYLNGWDVELK